MARRKGQVVTDTIEVTTEENGAGGSPSVEQLAVELLDRAKDEGISLVGPGGLLSGLTKTALESMLEGELTEHVGYEPYDPAGHHSGNSRNGTRKKTVLTEVGADDSDQVNTNKRVDDVLKKGMQFFRQGTNLLQLPDIVKREDQPG